MMKSKDCAVATALVIQGYLAANDALQLNAGDAFADSRQHLTDCLSAIRTECSDWAENLASGDQALPGHRIDVVLLEPSGADVARSPENLINAILHLASEVVDLSGPEMLGRIATRLSGVRPKSASAVLPAETQILVDAANELVAEIDEATERPVLKLAVFDKICGDLRSQGGAPYSGVEVRTLNLPSDLSVEQIQRAVEMIEDWEASHRSACELVADLCPVLRKST